ncbi:MAG TPA: hypothetical protein VHA07_01830 [Devosia sp.]|nr:hypothetical protein [Devosia sp.]
MLKLSLSLVLAAGLLSATPSLADSKDDNSGIGRGCTLDPFNHTMRCIDFDHCTTDKDGKKTCPVVVTPTRASLEEDGTGQTGPRHGQDYLTLTFSNAMMSSF